MKLINLLRSNKNTNLNTLIVLIIRCIVCVFFIALMGCFLGRLIVFLKANILLFDWEKDVLYSLKVGISAGTLAGIGIWIKARLQDRKNKKETSK